MEAMEKRLNELTQLLRATVSINDLSGTRVILEDEIEKLRNQVNDTESRVNALEGNTSDKRGSTFTF